MYRIIRLIAVLGLLATPLGASGQLPPDSNRLQPRHAPTPYSASEIRRDCGSGAWRLYRLETLVSGRWQTTLQTTRFVVSGAERTELEVAETNEAGEGLAAPQRLTSTWPELQAHASFPAAATAIEEVPVQLPSGDFETWLYAVITDQAKDEKRLWFAKSLAGPPVYMEHWRDRQLILKMTLVDYGPRE